MEIKDKPQIDKFREAAREAETDDSEANFDRVLGTIAKAPSPKAEPLPTFKAGDRIAYWGGAPTLKKGREGTVLGPDTEPGVGPEFVMVQFEKNDPVGKSIHRKYLRKVK